jgi:hypothetical protein
MKKINMRIIFVALLIFSVFGLIGKTAIAQDGGVQGRTGWGNEEVSAQFHVGPPTLSIRPITDPDDIPLLQAQIQAYVLAVQAYVQTLLAEIFDENFPF